MGSKRELEEETGLKDIYLEQLYTFTSKNRDPREAIANSPMRTWSVAHFALIDYTKVKPVAGSDAIEGSAKWVKISDLKNHEMAFDHEEIIDMAVERVRGKMNYSNVGFELVPEQFTIPELQDIFENVLGEKLDRNNFRTKILGLGILDKLDTFKRAGRGQPAPYYKLDRQKLKSLKGRSLF
jgi:8-oxo-dGTP diphosphatase